MHILSFNWHTPYLSLLAALDHTFDVAPANREGPPDVPWHEGMRPLTPNVTPIRREEALNRLKGRHYDMIIGHNVGDLIVTRDFSIPKILVFHTRLTTEAQASGKPEIIPVYRQQVRELISGVYCVFIAETKRYDWGLPGEVIMPGIDTSLYGGYTGEIARALRVGNLIKLRDLTSGYSIQQAILRDLSSIAIGDNPDIPGARPSRDWDDLKQAYRENRLLLVTNIPKWEDGYNLAMMEAMATGMPVVSLANPVSPLTDGTDGFVSADVPVLRQRVKQLLADRALATGIGAEGKRTVERFFPIGPFLERWERAIRRAYEWHPHEPSHIFVYKKDDSPESISPARSLSRRRNIILSYTSHPASPAALLKRALTQKHNLITVGSRLTSSIIDAWALGNLKENPESHDIETPELTLDTRLLRDRLPKEFSPDFFLWVETGLGGPPEHLEDLHIPKAAWFLFSHLYGKHHMESAKRFDVVFVAQQAFVPEFKRCGSEHVFWLPLACDPEKHGKVLTKKVYDVGFVGSLQDKRRAALLKRLAREMQVSRKHVFLREMADHFSRSCMVFNSSVQNGLNMRVFEGLCSGSMVLTDSASGLCDLFQHGEHLAIYQDESIVDMARYYLSHASEREEIAEKGRREVLDKHTFRHRADEVDRIMASF